MLGNLTVPMQSGHREGHRDNIVPIGVPTVGISNENVFGFVPILVTRIMSRCPGPLSKSGHRDIGAENKKKLAESH